MNLSDSLRGRLDAISVGPPTPSDPVVGALPPQLGVDGGSLRDQLATATAAFRAFLVALGLDVAEEHLRGTPERVARMYLTELFDREHYVFTTFEATTRDLVLVRDMPFVSVCSHHFIPIRGVAHVAYIPDTRMVGLSKLARVVDWCASAPQVQERMTDDIATTLDGALRPLALAVVLEAEHMCMAVRGVAKPGATTVTSALRGLFKDSASARAEALGLMGHGR